MMGTRCPKLETFSQQRENSQWQGGWGKGVQERKTAIMLSLTFFPSDLYLGALLPTPAKRAWPSQLGQTEIPLLSDWQSPVAESPV